ncbi:unnamed protein product, partial [Durusdinium trenchii]
GSLASCLVLPLEEAARCALPRGASMGCGDCSQLVLELGRICCTEDVARDSGVECVQVRNPEAC